MLPRLLEPCFPFRMDIDSLREEFQIIPILTAKNWEKEDTSRR